MASFALRLYFVSSSSPLVTCMSSRGFPMHNRSYVVDIVVVVAGQGADANFSATHRADSACEPPTAIQHSSWYTRDPAVGTRYPL